MAETEMTSFRLPAELAAALRQRALSVTGYDYSPAPVTLTLSGGRLTFALADSDDSGA